MKYGEEYEDWMRDKQYGQSVLEKMENEVKTLSDLVQTAQKKNK